MIIPPNMAETPPEPSAEMTPNDIAHTILRGWIESVSREGSPDARLVFERKGTMPNNQGVVLTVRAETLAAVLPFEYSKIIKP